MPQQRQQSDEVCEIFCYDEGKIKHLQRELEKQDIPLIARMFKALADDTRMKIAYALSQAEELCVCDVAHIIGSSTATASHHLRLLRHMGLARYRKVGKLVFYSLDDDHVRELIRLAVTHSKEKDGDADE